MALEHALLVSLSERRGSGLELSRRFERSIGRFWQATHQQIYRTLGRMVRDGWLEVETIGQSGRPDKKVYDVTPAGAAALAAWLGEPADVETSFRSDLAVRLRGASYGDRSTLLAEVRRHRDEHATRLAAYRQMAARDYPDPAALAGADLDQFLVLRGGVRLEQFWVDWLEEYLAAHDAPAHHTPRTTPDADRHRAATGAAR